ncbi:hypothetical protein G5B46_06415 [Caulobacter sp. 602-2]|uniref:Uncharacterized protein n=1 Tax=Caulobacter sp. 602-2 TaxID=2710887 RepID=A0A6G4QVG0_9CAUL|nr:hypothetical protein [Caulobacter sp. 602-2]NGM49235.1 hypothetical protein [Caulobacter sp. 602-2]
MIFFGKYIEQFRGESTPEKLELAELLAATRLKYNIHDGGNPIAAFVAFVDQYNWLGQRENKARFGISDNLARNLPGAMLQDYLVHLAIKLCEPYPKLEVFTEVKVPFGRYPIWQGGEVTWAQPSERSDIAVGYRVRDGEFVFDEAPWPRNAYEKLPTSESVLPIVTLNSKIRVSQSEFFDWHGREQLMTKGNPHCFSVQVALRKEMDLSIVEAAQAGEKFFLLGTGGERNVQPNPLELTRFVDAFNDHLADKMLVTSPP